MRSIGACLWLLCLGIAILVCPLSFAGEFKPRELLTNGDFEAGDKTPKDWPLGRGVMWEKEDGNHFLRLRPVKPGESVVASRNLPLEPDWGFLRISCRVRYRNIVMGVEGWHDGRIAMTFKDVQGQRVGSWPPVLHWSGSCENWKQESKEFYIPEGAVSVDISLALFQVQSGEIDFDDVSVMVVRQRPKLEDAPHPADWSGKIWETQTATRSRICLNGYWRFRPIGLGDDVTELKPEMLKIPPPVPKSPGWGWLKVPSCWPSSRAAHTPIAPDIWAVNVDWNTTDAAWYQRALVVPGAWQGRRLFLCLDMPQTQASVLVDGKPLGTVRWPGGRLDLTDAVKPGQRYTLTLFVTALPFEAEKLVAMREDMVYKAKSEIRFRGLCGDVYLESEPSGPRIAAVQFRPSVRKRQLSMLFRLDDLAPNDSYTITVEPAQASALRARVPTFEMSWTCRPFKANAIKDGTLRLTMPWMAKRLWDLDQPNLYDLRLQLRYAENGAILDERIERMGFREMWLEGRNIMLNGTPVHWRALNFSNHTANAGAASYEACRETFRRMRSLGFNFAILANYGFDPGETMTFDDLLRAADDEGYMLSFSMPHPFRSLGGYDVKRGLSEEWRRLAEYCVWKAQNHPSVLAYAMSHNTLGYPGDQNPSKMDGKYIPKPTSVAAAKNFNEKREIAAAAEQYVRELDPTRTVYHHQSGNMGDWHTINIYLCWAPIQERMEWLSHWAKEGIKPLFFVEWGLPHIASWGGHRLGPFIWRNKVNPEPLAIEFGAAITGDAAYMLTEDEERHIDRYERVYARGLPFHISEVLGDYWENAREHNMVEIQSEFTRHVWPAFRTWGISAMLPWDQGNMARKRPNAPNQVEVKQSAHTILTPGIHPDFLPNRGDYFLCADANSRELSSLGETFRRVNADFFAYLAGDPKRFTEQSHIFYPGAWVRKQVVLINDRRTQCTGKFEWVMRLLGNEIAKGGEDAFEIEPGQVKKWPLSVKLPQDTDGAGIIELLVTLKEGTVIRDTFTFHVLRKPSPITAEVAVIDPVGKTLAELKRLGIRAKTVQTPPTDCRALVIGRQALTVEAQFPDIAPILARGGTVVVMEQDEHVLNLRLGFRTAVPSLRRVFCRTPDHPVLAGLNDELLHDWTGEATLIPDRYNLPEWEETYPTVDWLGFKNTRAWKWGNQGQVASVVIEKPQRGDFLPLLDGGFDLKYTPLMEMRLRQGRIIFCQMDLSGRTEPEPAADLLLSNLIRYAQSASPCAPAVKAWCADAPTRRLLANLAAELATEERPRASDVAVAGRQSTEATLLRQHVEAGGVALLLDWSVELLKSVLPKEATVESNALTHTPPPLTASSAWRGVGPSDLHWRGRITVNTVRLPESVGNSVSTGVLASARMGKGRVVTCAVTPDRFDYKAPNKIYLKLTHNHTAFLVSRLLANLGVGFQTRLGEFWDKPVVPNLPLSGGWLGRADPEGRLTPERLSAPELDTSDWLPITVPSAWENQSPAWVNYDGVFWYRLVFEVSSTLIGEETQLALGAIDDEDWTYLNGKFIGHIGQDTNPNDYWAAPRLYPIPPHTLKLGRNILLIKVRDLRQAGGLVTGPVEIRVPPRWLHSYYLDEPTQLDDPYRYNRW